MVKVMKCGDSGRVRAGTLVALLAVIAVCGCRQDQVQSQQEPPQITGVPAAEGNLPRRLQGTLSCSTSLCHGGANVGHPFSEVVTSRAIDPHASAYETLLTSASNAIAQHLWKGNTQAHEAPLCLKCHVNPSYEHSASNFRNQDGVGCESCHGAAEKWLTPHYRQDAWGMLTAVEKRALGLADTKSLPGRATVCITCHVGTPTAAVDHDLIAAGHPALRFEFATYFANLPAHWDVAKDKKANSVQGLDFELRTWSVGQLVSAAGCTRSVGSARHAGKRLNLARVGRA